MSIANYFNLRLLVQVRPPTISMNYASPGPSSGSSVRTSQTTAEIRSFRQRVDTSKEVPEVLNRVGKFNTLNNSMLQGSRSTTLYPRQVSLFFMKKGYSKAVAHGSAKVIKFNKADVIANWQEYLVSEVLSHPAWKSFPNGQQYEIDPKRGVCVGFWEASGIPNANMMEGSGSIANLLEMCENPRLQEKNLTATTSGTGKGGRSSPVLSIRMAYTVHIRIINDSSSEDHLAGEESTEYDELEASTLSEREAYHLFQDQYLSEEKETLEVVPTISRKGKEKQTLATIDHDQSISAITSRPITPLNSRSQPTNDSLVPDPQSISTSAGPPLRKRSLTLLSPDKITTMSTRQTKKTRAPIVHLSSSDGDDESEHVVNVSDNSDEFLAEPHS